MFFPQNAVSSNRKLALWCIAMYHFISSSGITGASGEADDPSRGLLADMP